MKHNQFRSKITSYVSEMASNKSYTTMFLDLSNSTRMIYVYNNFMVCVASLYLSFSDKGITMYVNLGSEKPASYLDNTHSVHCAYTHINTVIMAIDELIRIC